jgi:pseudouridine-5'-phosphate glycosidase
MVAVHCSLVLAVCCSGLTEAELEELGQLGHKAMKCSRRDLAFVIATKAPGATTVAATMMVAHMVLQYCYHV